MGHEGGRRVDLAEAVESPSGATTLVLGETGHGGACERLARAGRGRAFRIRVAADADDSEPCADTADLYETGVYDDLPLPDAGIAVSDTVANLGREDRTTDDGSLVVCVDGLPTPSERDERCRLVQFLHAITHRVEDEAGHCHVHIDVGAESRAAAVLAPLFEQVVDADAAAP